MECNTWTSLNGLKDLGQKVKILRMYHQMLTQSFALEV